MVENVVHEGLLLIQLHLKGGDPSLKGNVLTLKERVLGLKRRVLGLKGRDLGLQCLVGLLEL
jgi:hypothetical protein